MCNAIKQSEHKTWYFFHHDLCVSALSWIISVSLTSAASPSVGLSLGLLLLLSLLGTRTQCWSRASGSVPGQKLPCPIKRYTSPSHSAEQLFPSEPSAPVPALNGWDWYQRNEEGHADWNWQEAPNHHWWDKPTFSARTRSVLVLKLIRHRYKQTAARLICVTSHTVIILI